MSAHPTTSTNRSLVTRLLVLTVAMFGFGFALVPLYNVFCQVTGFNGKTSGKAAAEVAYNPAPDRTVWIEFLANVNTAAPWSFSPVVTRMAVHPGTYYSTRFLARNPTTGGHTVQAIASVAPGLAARYLHKTECFCFRRQAFAAKEERELPLRFTIDPALPPEVGTLSLAYTLFDVPGG
jgi:cytochrome c oxidase assembly protein subunit 11